MKFKSDLQVISALMVLSRQAVPVKQKGSMGRCRMEPHSQHCWLCPSSGSDHTCIPQWSLRFSHGIITDDLEGAMIMHIEQAVSFLSLGYKDFLARKHKPRNQCSK